MGICGSKQIAVTGAVGGCPDGALGYTQNDVCAGMMPPCDLVTIFFFQQVRSRFSSHMFATGNWPICGNDDGGH